MQVFCMNYWYIFGQERPTQEEQHGRYGLFTPTWFWLVPAIHKNSLYMILACVAKWRSSAWITGIFFLARKCQHKNSYMDYAFFTPICILACASSLPVPAIYKKILYMILACVAKYRCSAWIIGTFSGQERPAQEQLHGRSGLFTPIWFWLVRLFYQWQLYTRKPDTWFWLVWPNAGLLYKLVVHFLARKGQHKNSYMDVLIFLRIYDSGLCACSTSASYI